MARHVGPASSLTREQVTLEQSCRLLLNVFLFTDISIDIYESIKPFKRSRSNHTITLNKNRNPFCLSTIKIMSAWLGGQIFIVDKDASIRTIISFFRKDIRSLRKVAS
ncbi:MAG: hypothetical protein ACUZ8O_00320 [Candidatus Anammoxibacter sp.]